MRAAPGNSARAFLDALNLGVDGVELDVRLSRDGVPIVHHNWYLDEGAARPLPIFSLTAEQIRNETIRDDRPDVSMRHAIPALQDVVEEFAGKMALEIELKSPEPELPSAVASVLRAFKSAWATVEFTSSSTSLLVDIRERCPGTRTALLFGRSAPYMHDDVVAYAAVRMAELAKADVVHLQLDQLTEEVVTTVTKARKEIHVYPVNTPEALELAWRHGVPEVVTDDPETILRLRAARLTPQQP